MVFRQENMLLGFVALIKGAGGHVEGRLKIQKQAFLLGLKGAPHFSPSSFGYKYYGPFSRELSDALQNAVTFDLVTEFREDFAENHSRYTYKLTEVGDRWLTGHNGAGLEGYQEDIELLQRQHWRTLELAATVAFFESRGAASDRKEAFEMALKYKPECEPYLKEAESILNSLGLR